MTASLSHRASHQDPLDVSRKALSLRSLQYKRQPVDIVLRVRGEFFEMRGFSPTVEQAARLFDLPRDECSAVLSGLVQQGFLNLTSDGRYRLTL